MRGPPVCLRDLTAEERSAVEALARSRTAPARQVERARVVLRASRGETPPGIAEALGLDAETVRRRIRRFNAEGLAAFDDHHRSGRPAPRILAVLGSDDQPRPRGQAGGVQPSTSTMSDSATSWRSFRSGAYSGLA